jgi:hypothetical protein
MVENFKEAFSLFDKQGKGAVVPFILTSGHACRCD